MKCKICGIKLDPRKDVRFSAGETMMCSWDCVWVYRGREKCT